MDYNLEIHKLLLKKDEAPLPKDKVNMLKQAIAIADSHNDVQWGFDLRIDLIEEESNTTQCADSFSAFAWVLDAYDKDPELFQVEHLIARYRWMLGESFRNVNISMGQIQQIFVDFKKRFRDNGYSLRTYYTAKVDFAFFLGDTKMIQENLALRDAEPVNQLFDYWLGEVYDNIEFVLRQGNFELAAQIERETSLEGLEYVFYPLAIYTSFMRYYAMAGKYEKAYEYFLKADECIPGLKNDQSQLVSMGKIIHFLSIYNRPLAWQYFEKYVNWTGDSEDCSSAYFAMDVLNLLKEKGERVLHVNPQLLWYRADNTYKIAELYDFFYKRAFDLSQRFDKRNGTNTFMRRLKKAQKVTPKNWLSALWSKLFKK